MILILSKANDLTTSTVLKWLYNFKQEFVRINGENTVTDFHFALNENEQAYLHYKDLSINLEKIQSFWYRRGKVNLEKYTKDKIQDDPQIEKVIHESIINEMQILEDYFYQNLKGKKSIGSYDRRGVNKLTTLNTAREIGLKIPQTIITTDKKKVAAFLKKHQAIITKPIHEVPINLVYGKKLLVYTSEIHKENLAQLPDIFFPSLFQEKINKKYELRIFYLNGKCYGTAIFSQLDEQTSVDLRNYNMQKPNRRIPFNIPDEIEEKLMLLMNKLELNCGSIDLIVTTDNEFVFLEVNPIGQFGFTSVVGNFQLEKEIAKYLSS